MISREGIKFIANSQSTAAVIATQALAERAGVLLFTGVWGKSVKGTAHPMTFTNLNSPPEILRPLFEYVQKHHPEAKTVAILNPNDASGQEVAEESVRQWERLGYTIVYNDYFERSTTDFSPIATRILAANPDIVDAGASPLPNVGHVFREMQTQGWDGVKIASSGSEAAVFDGENATDTQRELNARALAELGQPLNQATIAAWDSVFALKVAMEQANSVDPKVVAETLPTITFESSYGPSGFGHADTYGLPNQMLLPVIITQVKDGKMVELDRIVPEELKSKM
jgi:branched-chain amino acid transport system substrate-binding protein